MCLLSFVPDYLASDDYYPCGLFWGGSPLLPLSNRDDNAPGSDRCYKDPIQQAWDGFSTGVGTLSVRLSFPLLLPPRGSPPSLLPPAW